MTAKRKKTRRLPPLCSFCDHAKTRHTIAGCMGDGGPGSNCSCDDYEAPP